MTDTSRQRSEVFRRDNGRCAACGCDTEKLRRILRWCDYTLARTVKADLGVSQHRTTLWDMDHKTPVVDGGGVTKDSSIAALLANLQTLCWRCHREKTTEHARQRAAKRKIEKDKQASGAAHA